MEIGTVSLGGGNDTMRIGRDATVTLASLDFGDGIKDTLTIGVASTLTVTGEFNLDSLDTLTMGSDSMLYVNADTVGAAQEKFSRYASQIAAIA